MLKRIWLFVVDNIDNLLMIVVSVIAGIFGLVGVNNPATQSIVLAAICVTLGLLAFEHIRAGHERDILAGEIKKLRTVDDLISEVSRLRDEISARGNPFRRQASERKEFNFENMVLQAETLDLLGYNFANFLGTFREVLAHAVEMGLRVRIMIVDPSSIAGDLIRENFTYSDVITDAYERSIRYISEIKTILNEKGHASGALEVKLVSWIPSCHLNIINSKKDNGIASISINSLIYKTGFPRRLDCILQKNLYPQEFEFFASQYDMLWQSQLNKTFDASL